jgi:hypothetical protein
VSGPSFDEVAYGPVVRTIEARGDQRLQEVARAIATALGWPEREPRAFELPERLAGRGRPDLVAATLHELGLAEADVMRYRCGGALEWLHEVAVDHVGSHRARGCFPRITQVVGRSPRRRGRRRRRSGNAAR